MKRKRLFRIGWCIAALLPLSGLSGLRAQTSADCEFWAAQKDWNATFSLKANSSLRTGLFDYHTRQTISATMKQLRLQGGSQCPQLRWAGQLTDTVSMNDEMVVHASSCDSFLRLKAQGNSVPRDVLLTMDFTDRTFRFSPGQILADISLTSNCPMATTFTQKPLATWGPARPSLDSIRIALPPPMTGQKRFKAASHLFSSDTDVPPADWDLSWEFTAFELVIDPAPYTAWRPVAGPDENTPPPTDKDIEIRATLQQVGGQPAPVKAKKFTFELVKTSQQLGTTMNYPLKKVAKTTFDLQFLPERNTELTVSNEGQKAETRTGESEKVTAKVTPFDYGGWSTIRVTAEMPDGSKIVGYLRGDKSQTEIRLPKRAPDSKIADAWKKEKGVDLADDDDKEGWPSGLKGCDGDGLTLYEEYRGFMENSEHIEGDPNKKDLFIYHNGGPIIDFGITLFAERTFLAEGVHKRLTKAEVDLENRIINENWTRDAAHAVDQHALVINSNPTRTAIIWDSGQNFDGKRGRPKIVKAIDIAPDQEDVYDYAQGVFPTEGGGTYESVWLGARTVLHMLLHAVGVEHHGPADLDRFVDLTFLWPEDPGNTYGRPVFVHTDGELITLLDERTGADFAPTYLAARQRAVERDMAWVDSRHSGPLHDALVSYLKGSSLTLLLGLWNGPHSGAEDCPMRRHYADAYPSESSQGDYFLVPPGTEPAGIIICQSEKGTGINAEGRKPQGRYYDALGGGYASCGSWICINDAFPLTDRPPNAGRRFVTR